MMHHPTMQITSLSSQRDPREYKEVIRPPRKDSVKAPVQRWQSLSRRDRFRHLKLVALCVTWNRETFTTSQVFGDITREIWDIQAHKTFSVSQSHMFNSAPSDWGGGVTDKAGQTEEVWRT